MKITGDQWLERAGNYTPPKSATAAARDSFTVVTSSGIHVTRRPSEVLIYPDDTPLLVSVHDMCRVYSKAMTVGELRAKVKARAEA